VSSALNETAYRDCDYVDSVRAWGLVHLENAAAQESLGSRS